MKVSRLNLVALKLFFKKKFFSIIFSVIVRLSSLAIKIKT